MNSTSIPNANDPITPLKDFFKGAIEAGFYSEQLDLLPGNLVFTLDPTVDFEVTLYAVKAALQSLADDGHIVDTGRRVGCDITGDEEIVWAKADSLPDCAHS